jgi:hypothetical protein
LRTRTLRARYRAFRAAHDDMKPVDYDGKERWTPIPKEFMRAARYPFAGPLWRAADDRKRRELECSIASRDPSPAPVS